MPAGEAGEDKADDARDYGQHDVIHWHDALAVLAGGADLVVDPGGAEGEAEEAVDGGVEEEEEEGLVVAEADAGRQPRAVVVHLQDTSATGGAVVDPVGLRGVALLAEARGAGGLDGQGGGWSVGR